MRIYVSLKPAEASRLSELAERERRHPKDQAAYLIARALNDVEPKRDEQVSLPAVEARA